MQKRNIFTSPSSVFEMAQKNWLHKPPGLVNFSLKMKEGINEKDLCIHNNFDGNDSLCVTSSPDI
jgi:hypothetical protein